MAEQLERLSRVFRACTCGRPTHRPPEPSSRFERCHFLSSGCHLQQEVVLDAFYLALKSGAFDGSGIPGFITTNPCAQGHLSGILLDLVYDPDSDWADSCGGNGCTPAVVRALLACGVGAPLRTVFFPVWRDTVAHPYSLAAFAASEAVEAVLKKGVAESAIRAEAEGWIDIALQLFEADSPLDAPEAVALWGRPTPRHPGGSASASVGGPRAALWRGGPESLPREPPCAMLCDAEALVAWSKKHAGRAPLARAAELAALAARETPAHLAVCPRCSTVLPARPPPVGDLAELFPSLFPFPTTLSSTSPLEPWDLSSAPDLRILEDLCNLHDVLSAPELQYVLETGFNKAGNLCKLRFALTKVLQAAIKAGGALLAGQDANTSDVCMPAPASDTAPLHKVVELSASPSATQKVLLRIIRLLRTPDGLPVILVAWAARPICRPPEDAKAWAQSAAAAALGRLILTQPALPSVLSIPDASSDGVRLLNRMLSASTAAAGAQLAEAFPAAGAFARSCGANVQLALLPLLYPVVHNPPFALGAPTADFSFESEEAQLAGMATADPPQWQAVRTLEALKRLSASLSLFRTAYCKDKAALLRRMARLHPETRALVRAACERAGVWDGGAELPPEWAGVELPSVEHRSVVPAAEPDGASRVRVVRMSPTADGRGVDVDRSLGEAGGGAGGAAASATAAAVRLCSSHGCSKALPGDAPLKCGACSRVFYCGRDCQRADWRARHRVLCPQLQAETAEAAAAARAAM